MRGHLVRLVRLVLALACATAHAQENLAADINETVFRLPTTVKTMYGQVFTRDMTVTQFKPAGDGPFPIAVLLHGRSPTDRSQPARQRYLQAARYFVRRGFAVWIPTRLGYGESGLDPDPEDTGLCNHKVYPPGYEAAATSALDVIAYAKRQAFADPARVVVLGQSYGGATAITLAAKNPPGVLGTINFAGGGGGDPVGRTYNPCRPDLLQDMFAEYGKTARIPTMWVYTENDKYFGPAYPKQWHAAFVKNGGKGTFEAMPAFGEDGHLFFSRGFPQWRPVVDRFLQQLGFAIPKTADAPPATAYAALDDVEKLPRVGAEAREKYRRFLQLDIPRAYAIGPKGEYAYYSSPDAMQRVLDICRKHANTDCKLYAVDDHITLEGMNVNWQTIDVAAEAPVATVTLNRPDVRNAFNETTIEEITRAFRELGGNGGVRAIVLAANGPAFCAGADLNWMKKMAGYTHEENRADAAQLAEMLRTIYTCPKPVVAKVQGDCYAGGMGLVAACDIVIAAEQANFCLSEVKLGLIPATISPYVLRGMGENAARRYFLTAERFSVQEAHRIGFVHALASQDTLDAMTADIVKALVTNSPNAVREAKRLVQDVAGRPLTAALIADTAERIADIRSSDEGKEGVRSFLEKRKPDWLV